MKRTLHMLFIICAACLMFIACGDDSPQKSEQGDAPNENNNTISVASKKGFVLTMSDEFDGNELNTDIWTAGLPIAWNTISLNNEEQGYVEENVVVNNGTLKLKMEKRTVNGPKNGSDRAFDYASGAITTSNKFFQKYGLIEMRAKLPGGAGTWPAFWLMPESENTWAPYGAEIDILEHFTVHGTSIQTGIFYDGYGDEIKHWKEMITVPTYDSEFHVYSCEWTPSRISIYVDGKAKATYNRHSLHGGMGVPASEHYIIINSAMGGWGGTIDDSALPAQMEIDYVKVYQFEDEEEITGQENERFGEVGLSRFTFENTSIDEVTSNYARAINTEVVALTKHRATITDGQIDKKTEVLSGTASLKGNTSATHKDYNEIFITPANQFKKDANYEVMINFKKFYKEPEARFYMVAKTQEDGAANIAYEEFGTNQWSGRATVTFKSDKESDTNVIIGIFKRGTVVIDDIIIKEIKE